MDKIKNIWDKKYNKIMEKRLFEIETRMEEGETVKVVGHASVYNTMSEDLGGFREIIAPGAFDDVLENDVRALINHDGNLILARTTSVTLAFSSDEKGLRYEFEMPETSYGKDLAVSMKRGDITQSSFAFTVADDSWDTRDGMDVRTINKVKRLYDVSPVSIPAYPSANDLALAQRSKMIYNDKQKMQAESNYEMKTSLDKLKLKINILKRKRK